MKINNTPPCSILTESVTLNTVDCVEYSIYGQMQTIFIIIFWHNSPTCVGAA